jgi:hypothetical protein
MTLLENKTTLLGSKTPLLENETLLLENKTLLLESKTTLLENKVLLQVAHFLFTKPLHPRQIRASSAFAPSALPPAISLSKIQ